MIESNGETTTTKPRRGGTGTKYKSEAEKRVLDKLVDESKEKTQRIIDQRNADNIRDKLRRQICNDIYPIPEVVNPERRMKCEFSLINYSETYHRERFYLRWSKNHLLLLERIERMILDKRGELLAMALPRGTGKSTIVETAIEWAFSYGHLRFPLLILASNKLAQVALGHIKEDLLSNMLVYDDFPEICYPIRMSGGVSIKTKAQHLEGEPTNVVWGSDRIVLPTIEGSKTSGHAMQCTSITSSLRGLLHRLPSGEMIRPDAVILDDIQNDKLAKNAARVSEIEKKVMGAVRGLAGPGKPLTMIMPCTVIRKDDVAERFLDREKKPQWQGMRTKLMEFMPKNMELWNKYNDIRLDSYRKGNRGIEATEFYRENRIAMEEGAVSTWEHRYNSGTNPDEPVELSAIQHAMNLYFDDPTTFASEYQNEPLEDLIESKPRIVLESKSLMERMSGYSYGVVPESTLYITSGIDIQGKILYYTTTAWIEDFGGVIIDVGTYPEQPEDYFTASEPPTSMQSMVENTGKLVAPCIYTGLQYLHSKAFSRKWIKTDSGVEIPLSRGFIDANWAVSIDAVYQFCKEIQSGEIYFPCHGRGIGVDQLPIDMWVKKQGEIKGKNWIRRPRTISSNRGSHYIFDTNFWKSTIAERLSIPLGTSNALTIWGNDKSRMRYQQLRLLCDHIASEGMVRKQGRGREVDLWTIKVGQENHFWDCLIMSAVAASTLGVPLHEIIVGTNTAAIPPHKRKRVPTPDVRPDHIVG